MKKSLKKRRRNINLLTELWAVSLSDCVQMQVFSLHRRWRKAFRRAPEAEKLKKVESFYLTAKSDLTFNHIVLIHLSTTSSSSREYRMDQSWSLMTSSFTNTTSVFWSRCSRKYHHVWNHTVRMMGNSDHLSFILVVHSIASNSGD